MAANLPRDEPSGGRRRYSAQFRADAVARAAAPGAPVAAVARELGVSPTTLRRWIRAGEEAARTTGPAATRPATRGEEDAAENDAAERGDERPLHERIEEEWPDWRTFDWPVLPQEEHVIPASAPPDPPVGTPRPSMRAPQPVRPRTSVRGATESYNNESHNNESHNNESHNNESHNNESHNNEPGTIEPRTIETGLPPPSRPGDDIFPALSRLGPARRITIIVVALLLAVAASTVVPADYALRPVVLAVHVLSMVAAFGAVLLIDWHGLLWLAGRRGLTESTRLAAAAGPVIWGGLGGLIVSGALLRPDIGSPLTVTKLVLVFLVAANGAVMSAPRRRLASLPEQVSPVELPERDWRRLMLATTLSQVGWWGAVVIGFINAAS